MHPGGAPPPGYPYPFPPPPPPPPRSKAPLIFAIIGGVVVVAFIGVFVWKAMATAQKFDNYAKRAKRSEAELNLDAIKKAAKVHFVEMAAFPQGSAALTPETSCCEGGSNRKCQPDPAAWDAEIWQTLDFMVSEPHYFQYAYESDGQRLTARAVGDLDCDYTTVEYVLEGTIVNGSPEFTLTTPTRSD